MKLNEIVERVFNIIKFECRPDKDEPFFNFMFETFFGGVEKRKTSNFVGGINDKRNTLHENMFLVMWGDSVKAQVHFGTGKGGYEKYLTKRYTADFYDEENDIIYEIDGDSHKTELQILKDRLRDYFFLHELGIRTIRISNKRVEQILIDELNRKYESGEYDEFFNEFR